jgi:hypothetical protein
MIDIVEKKEKILEFLKSSGPSIPVRIAKRIEMDPIFASAILSELLNSRKIVLSHMRIGSTPLYLLPGEEERLEEHVENLKPLEMEAYLALKESVTLSDIDQPPAFRVALRNLKDFSKPFNHNGEMMWKYAFSSEEEVEASLGGGPVKGKPQEERGLKEERPLEKISEKVAKKAPVEKMAPKKKEDIFEKSPESPGFFIEVKDFLNKKDIEFIEEIQSDKKEIVGLVKMKTPLGDLQFLLIAKNKKTTSKDEIKSAIQRSIHSKMPCLFLLKKEPTRNIMTFLEENKNLIKLGIL